MIGHPPFQNRSLSHPDNRMD
jgi:hypothetical protein